MSKSSPSRQLRRIPAFTLSPEVIGALQTIVQEYHPNAPLTKGIIPGIVHDSILLWGQMILDKRKKAEEKGEVVTDETQSEEIAPAAEVADVTDSE
jgi:hypothetical protein